MKENLTLRHLTGQLTKEPAFRLKQVFKGFFSETCLGFPQISSLPLALRERLETVLDFSTFKEVSVYSSGDGKTRKALFTLYDGQKVESVLMPNAREQHTICVSTQSGCPVGCVFCATGALGYKRNLDSLEIAEQYCFWNQLLKKNPGNRRISNIVLMGMGEPLLNYEAVREALSLWLSYTDVGPGYITVSSVGVFPQIQKILSDPEWPPVKIALSLHSADAEIRKKLVPSSVGSFLNLLKEWCRDYLHQFGSRSHPLTFEYVLLKNQNDSREEALKLAGYLKGLDRIKVNLIPFNAHGHSGFKSAEGERALAFQKILEKAGIIVTIRKSLGMDIQAACGQLAGKEQKPQIKAD